MKELKMFHPNAKGTGACLKISETPTDIMLQVFPQGPSKGGFPSFNWDHPITFIADWCDLAKMLMVFRGECESIEDGKGLLYTHDARWSRLILRHVIEPVHCYALEIYERNSDDVESRGIVRLLTAEALGLSLVFEGILNHTLIGGEP